ncbi:MAG: LCP family protein [Kineosporiaceae bacterium]
MLVRRAVTLLLLTLLLPGSAHWVAGDRRVAKIALGVVAGCVTVVLVLAVAAAIDLGAVLGILADSTLLRLVAVLALVAGLGEAALLVDAWRLGQPAPLPRRVRPAIAAGTALAVLLVVTVAAGGARRAWAGASLIDDVFHGGAAAGAVDGRFTVLLLGGDAGPDRVGTRPDSVTLASIDATTGRTVLFSLPRNLEDVPFAPGSSAARVLPSGWSCGDACLLNAIYTWGAGHANLFPGARDPGAEAMKEAVAGVTGLTVNYYVLIDLQGFRQLIDAVGGITVTVKQPVPIGGGTSRVKGYIEPGTQHLDGYHALWLARSRHGASDYARMQRQRCVMNAMLHQLDPAKVLANFEDIAAAGSHVVSTDLPAGELGRFVGLAAGARGQPLTSVQFVPPLLDPAHPDMAVVRAKVAQTLQAASGPASVPAPSATKPARSGTPASPGTSARASTRSVPGWASGSSGSSSGSSGPGSSASGSSGPGSSASSGPGSSGPGLSASSASTVGSGAEEVPATSDVASVCSAG